MIGKVLDQQHSLILRVSCCFSCLQTCRLLRHLGCGAGTPRRQDLWGAEGLTWPRLLLMH